MTNSLIALLLLAPIFHLGAAERLFDDPIVAEGRGVEVRQSQVDDAFTLLKANRAASGDPIFPGTEFKLRRQILDKLVATQLLMAKATPKDRDDGKTFADKFIAETKSKAPSEASFKRQLIALGTTYEQYRSDVLEQAIVKTVVDRELKNKEIVTPQDIRKFYDENPELFEEPEQLRVRQILFATRRIPSGADLGPALKREKRTTAEKALARARAGEDFVKLVGEYSEDTQSKSKGEILFTKGSRAVPPEFEAAASSLVPGKISDIVETVFGYHIIKLEEKTPAKKTEIDKVQEHIREAILEVRVKKKLPGYLEEIKKNAEVKITLKEDEG